MKTPVLPGEVWIIDLGMAAKVRPCLILSDYPADNELALVTVMAHTTALRGNTCEIEISTPFLADDVFHLQQIHSIPVAKLERKIGSLTLRELSTIREALKARLHL